MWAGESGTKPVVHEACKWQQLMSGMLTECALTKCVLTRCMLTKCKLPVGLVRLQLQVSPGGSVKQTNHTNKGRLLSLQHMVAPILYLTRGLFHGVYVVVPKMHAPECIYFGPYQ